jgi:hypothetical protein
VFFRKNFGTKKAFFPWTVARSQQFSRIVPAWSVNHEDVMTEDVKFNFGDRNLLICCFGCIRAERSRLEFLVAVAVGYLWLSGASKVLIPRICDE